MWNTSLSPLISHSMRKCSETQRIGRAWEIGNHFLHQRMGTFLPSDSHLMICFTTWEMHAFSHQFLIARKRQQNSPCQLSVCFSVVWLFLLAQNCSNSLKRQAENTGNINSLKKKKEKKNQFQASCNSKQNISKEKERMDVISSRKRNIIICLAKACHPTKNFPYFLIISSKNCMSQPKIEKCNNHVFWQESVPVF